MRSSGHACPECQSLHARIWAARGGSAVAGSKSHAKGGQAAPRQATTATFPGEMVGGSCDPRTIQISRSGQGNAMPMTKGALRPGRSMQPLIHGAVSAAGRPRCRSNTAAPEHMRVHEKFPVAFPRIARPDSCCGRATLATEQSQAEMPGSRRGWKGRSRQVHLSEGDALPLTLAKRDDAGWARRPAEKALAMSAAANRHRAKN